MTTRQGLRLLSCFIEFAKTLIPEPERLIKFGIYRGRVSALMGQIRRPGDHLHLVDVAADHLEQDKLRRSELIGTHSQ
jgi:hypothetical protein